jgi:hypothetical protein
MDYKNKMDKDLMRMKRKIYAKDEKKCSECKKNETKNAFTLTYLPEELQAAVPLQDFLVCGQSPFDAQHL